MRVWAIQRLALCRGGALAIESVRRKIARGTRNRAALPTLLRGIVRESRRVRIAPNVGTGGALNRPIPELNRRGSLALVRYEAGSSARPRTQERAPASMISPEINAHMIRVTEVLKG